MNAWDLLTAKSSAPDGSTAWEHVNAITGDSGGGGSQITIIGELSSSVSNTLVTSSESAISSSIDVSVLTSDIITKTATGIEHMSATITTGDDARIYHTLKKNELTFDIPNTATVTCRLVTNNHEPLTSVVTVQQSTPGSDWSNSLLAIVLPAVNTEEVVGRLTSWKNGTVSAKLETQVNDGGKLTWFEPVTIVKGTIL